MAVVGHQRRDVELAADLDQTLAHTTLDGQAVVHQLEEEVVLAPDLLPLRGGFERFALVAEAQARLDLARRAAGRGDDALVMVGDELFVHTGPLAELTLDRCEGGQLEQVPQARRVLGDHRHVGVGTRAGDVVGLLAGITPLHTLGGEARLRRDVRLDADDRLDAELLGDVVELAGAVHVSVVGHAHGRHPQPFGLLEQRSDLRGTVEHRVLGVGVQMNERVSHACLSRDVCGQRRV